MIVLNNKIYIAYTGYFSDYRSGAIEWSGLAYQVSSLITNYLNAVLQRSTRNNLKTRDALQHVLKLLQSIAK